MSLLDSKVVYRRYASLFFIAGCASTDNELITLEIVHRFVEQMDKYYGNVCELDIIFNFQKAYFILDELLLAGEMQESSRKNVLRCISQQDSLEDMEVSLILWFNSSHYTSRQERFFIWGCLTIVGNEIFHISCHLYCLSTLCSQIHLSLSFPLTPLHLLFSHVFLTHFFVWPTLDMFNYAVCHRLTLIPFQVEEDVVTKIM